MSSPQRVLVVFGTRPEAIKMAPVVAALRAHPRLEPVVAVTGQHGRILDEVLDLFRITPDVDLALHSPGQTLEQITARAISGLKPVIDRVRPAAILAQGDTTTTFAAALTGFYARVPVVHLEAGLRTGDLHNPFPEEANRRLTTQLATLHLAATPANRDTLLAERVDRGSIVTTGNTVIDALEATTREPGPWNNPTLRRELGPSRARGDRPTVLVTAHRRESWGEPLTDVARAVATVARSHADTQFIWPLHANPAVRGWVAPEVQAVPNVVLTGPAGYRDFTRLLSVADVALTDSGGIQEEAPALGVPVLVTRNVTERHEAVDCGAARLVGTTPSTITTWLSGLLDDPDLHAAMRVDQSPYGDGHAAKRSAAAVASLLGVGDRLPDFTPTTAPLGATR